MTDAWSPRSWPKRSRMSMRPLISRACSTSSSSVRTDTHCELGSGKLNLCLVNPPPRYLHMSPCGEQESGKNLGMGEGREQDYGWQFTSSQADITLHTTHQSWGCSPPHLQKNERFQAVSAAWEKDAFGTAEATLWQRQESHSSSSARVNEIKQHV